MNLKIIVYKCTTGGNSLDPAQNLSVVTKNPGLIPTAGIINLFYIPAYTALITFRALVSGVADGLVTLTAGSPLEKAFIAMEAITPPMRNSMVSSNATWRHVFGGAPPSTTVSFEKWAGEKATQLAVRKWMAELGSTKKPGSIRDLIWSNRLPGWPGGDGEENHDLLLPDFAWEYLPA
ncbi:hypothetical protein ACWC4E_33205 [Streptomyces sp. NPDC001273]|uniref:hypothetical protein n=1 Tax=unclassified Streptomyces TaxID=2593676 RepID=UPI0033DB60DE